MNAQIKSWHDNEKGKLRMITEFNKCLSEAWIDAACDIDQRVLVVSLISDNFNDGAGEAAVSTANRLDAHISGSENAKDCRFLGASKLGGAFPQIAYTLPEDPKLSAAAIGVVRDFFDKNPDAGGYGLNYNRWDG